MEHILLSAVTIGSKKLAISRARLDNMLINTNQASDSIYRWVNSDLGISFGSFNSGNKISIDFGQNMNYDIRVNP